MAVLLIPVIQEWYFTFQQSLQFLLDNCNYIPILLFRYKQKIIFTVQMRNAFGDM